MANNAPIDSLLVELGLEADSKSFKEAEGLFKGLGTKALQFGALIGTGLGAKDLTFGFAKATDQLGRFAERFSTTPEFVDALGFAFTQTNADADEAFNSIEKIANLIENTDWGNLPSDAFRVAGFDPMMLQGVKSVEEAYARIANAVKDLSPEAQRRSLGALGFGGTEVDLFTGKGGSSLQSKLQEGYSFNAVSKAMTEQGKEFNKSTGRLVKAVDAIANMFSELVIDDLTDAINTLTNYLKGEKGGIAQYMNDYARVAASPIESTTNLFKDAFRLLRPSQIRPPRSYEARSRSTTVNDDLVDLNNPKTSDALFEEMVGIKREPVMLDLNNPETSDALFEAQMSKEGMAITNNINVDARGATNPQEVESAARRGVESAMANMVDSTIQDIQSNLK